MRRYREALETIPTCNGSFPMAVKGNLLDGANDGLRTYVWLNRFEGFTEFGGWDVD